jgi:hypothetical protein
MICKGNHAEYEKGISEVMRKSKLNFISVNEQKKGLLPNGKKLKNFDAIINSLNNACFIADFKGRFYSYGCPTGKSNNFENWIFKNAVNDLLAWGKIFQKLNCSVTPLLIFIYKLQPEQCVHFKDVYTYKRQKYGVVAIKPEEYKKFMKPRSGIKDAVSVSRKVFKTKVRPLSDFIPEIIFDGASYGR